MVNAKNPIQYSWNSRVIPNLQELFVRLSTILNIAFMLNSQMSKRWPLVSSDIKKSLGEIKTQPYHGDWEKLNIGFGCDAKLTDAPSARLLFFRQAF